MYMTILHGHVKKENRRTLEESYGKKCKHPPEGLLQTFLIHSKSDKSEWKIISVWNREEDYNAAKKAGLADTCENLFCDAGSAPARSHYDVGGRFIKTVND